MVMVLGLKISKTSFKDLVYHIEKVKRRRKSFRKPKRPKKERCILVEQLKSFFFRRQ